ncbi:T-cell differentiation antigen CD6 isoform X2 [Rhinatrema bivittatum]|uniref:T-cell differentiation antigen CD6 isoform X2 n=1 Tax=Rhinatrema bivittatum TaxID=194408 RepID=UPI00112C1016|nr:T-cell differentiation antigen CD6 isoform X2 [Rhinatrema bivittatum]
MGGTLVPVPAVLLLAILAAAAPRKGWLNITESPMFQQPPPESTERILPRESEQSLVRLVNGSSQCGGTVQLLHQGEWSPLCSEFAKLTIVSIFCRELKCGKAKNSSADMDARGPHLPGNDTVTVSKHSSASFLSIHCPGSEEGLENCSTTRLGPGSCPSGRAAVITCTEHRELRLVGAGSRCAGRVEIEVAGDWGTVCDDAWDLRDADVVCHQLRCGSALQVLGASYFGQGAGPIHLDEVNCTGNESHLWDCPAKSHHDCGHKEDAGVECSEHRELRLSGGRDRCTGRAEVYFKGTWATVCENIWFPEDGDLLCRFLGCGAVVSRLRFHHTLPGRMSFLCAQGTASPWDCQQFFNNSNVCGPSAAVGVICAGSLGLLNMTTAMEETEEVTSGAGQTITGSGSGKEVTGSPRNAALLSICIILAVLLLGTLLAFVFFVLRRQKKPVAPILVNHSLQTSNVSSTASNDYGNPTSLAEKAAVPALDPNQQDSDSDYEDYDFSSKPPLALSTFYNSLRYKPINENVQQRNVPMASLPEGNQDVDGSDSEAALPKNVPERGEHYHNQPSRTAPPPASGPHTASPCPPSAAFHQASQAAEDTSSTSSEEEGWYENFHPPQAGNVPPLTVTAVPSLGRSPQEDSTDGEYDEVDSST